MFDYSIDEGEQLPVALSLLIENGSQDITSVFNDSETYSAFIYFVRTFSFKTQEVAYIFDDEELSNFLAELLMFLYHNRNEVNFDNNSVDMSQANKNLLTDVRDKYLFVLNYVLYTINVGSFNSKKFNQRVSNNKIFDAHIFFKR